MIKLVQHMYTSRHKTNVETAKLPIDSFTLNNEFNKFKSLVTEINTTSNNTTETSVSKRDMNKYKETFIRYSDN